MRMHAGVALRVVVGDRRAESNGVCPTRGPNGGSDRECGACCDAQKHGDRYDLYHWQAPQGSAITKTDYNPAVPTSRRIVRVTPAENTDEICSRPVKWSDHALLALDEKSGNVVQGWVEEE